MARGGPGRRRLGPLRIALAALALTLAGALARPLVAQGLTLADLPAIQEDLWVETASLDDPAFRSFAGAVFRHVAAELDAESLRARDEKDPDSLVDWPRVLASLSELAAERELSSTDQCLYGWQHAQFYLYKADDCVNARRIVTETLERYPTDEPYSAWIALMGVDIDRATEDWEGARAGLALAERGMEKSWSPEMVRSWYDGCRGELWIDLGMADLARPAIEAEIEASRAIGDPNLLRSALDHELKLMLAEYDFEALDARERQLEDDPWYQGLSPGERERFALRFALGWLVREQRELAPYGAAARRLDGILERDLLGSLERLWALRHRALIAADMGEWDLAARTCERLGAGLGDEGGACASAGSMSRLDATRIALEARVAAVRWADAPDRAARLRPYLDALDGAWTSFLASWSGAPVRGGGLAYLGQVGRHFVLEEQLDLTDLVLDEPQSSRRALELVLQAESFTTLARRMQLATPTVEQALHIAREPGAGALVYVPLRDHTFVLALDARGVRLFRLRPAYHLEDTASRLVVAVHRTVRDGGRLDDLELAQAAAAAQAEYLSPELERWIADWRRLTLIGLDDAGYVPFELFPAGGGETQGTRREIVYAPSVPVALELARRASTSGPLPQRARLVLAPEVDPASELPPLHLQQDDVRALVEAAGVPCESYLGRDARAARLGLGVGEDTPLACVLTHGTYDWTRDRPAGILVAGDAGVGVPLDAEAIEALRVPCTILLNACGAGRATQRRGDGGRSDLATAFLMAGATTVVLPTTQLELGATLRVAGRVLEGLGKGRSPAAALHRARAALARAGDGPAALHAHLMHVVGAGARPLWPERAPSADEEAAPTSSHAMRWLPVPVALLLVLPLVLRARRHRNGARRG